MKETLPCPGCDSKFRVSEILEHSTISWPDLNWIYFQCPNCEKHTHIQVKKEKMATVNFIGAPGPDWELIKSINVPSLEARMDPGFAHVWLEEKHYEFKARE